MWFSFSVPQFIISGYFGMEGVVDINHGLYLQIRVVMSGK